MLIAIAVVAGLLSNCAVTPEPTEAPEAPPPEGVTVTFFAWAATDFEQDAINKMVDQFQVIHPDVEVVLTFGPR
jgi:ABC-type glycerol-3-phosphate transport system substrate-binding protein